MKDFIVSWVCISLIIIVFLTVTFVAALSVTFIYSINPIASVFSGIFVVGLMIGFTITFHMEG